MEEMTREEWLKARKEGIGASDAAAVCGVSPWQTQLEVYLDKTTDVTEDDFEKKPWLKLGQKLEPVIAELYSEKTGAELALPPALQRHKEFQYIMANPDRTRTDDSRNVQCKSAAFRDPELWGEEGSDEIPEWYLVQVQHEMTVCGANLTDLAVLFGGREFCVYSVPYDKAMADEILDVERKFWNEHVIPEVPPQPDFEHATTVALIKAMYGVDESKIVDLPDIANTIVADYNNAAEAMKLAKKEQDEAKAKLLSLMGEAAVANIEGGPTITRKMVQRKGYEVKPSEYIRFSIKKGAKQ